METKKYSIPRARTLLIAVVLVGVFLMGSTTAWGIWGAQTEDLPLVVIG